MKRAGGAVLLAIAVIIGLFFPRWGDQPERLPPPRQKLVLATATPMSGLAVIAHDRGFMADEGVEVTLQKHETGLLALQSLLKNTADMATVAEYPVVMAVLRGERPRILATIASATKNIAVVARKDRGITTIGDLRGKKVGVAFGTDSEFLLEMLLALNHLPTRNIEKINISPRELPNALITDQVDAICTFHPFLLIVQRLLGDNHVLFSGGDIYTETFNLVAREDYIANDPQIVERTLRAMLRAAKFAEQEPEAAREVVARHTQLDRKLLDEIWSIYDYRLTQDQSLITTMESQAKWAIRSGQQGVKTFPNFLEVLYLDGMSKLNPATVTVIH